MYPAPLTFLLFSPKRYVSLQSENRFLSEKWPQRSEAPDMYPAPLSFEDTPLSFEDTMPYYNVRQFESMSDDYIVKADHRIAAKLAIEEFRDGKKSGDVVMLQRGTDSSITILEADEKDWPATKKPKPPRKKK